MVTIQTSFHVVPLMECTYISKLLRFSRVCSHVDDFNAWNKWLTAKLHKQCYRYHKLKKGFFRVLSPTQWVAFKILCRIKVSLTSRSIGTRILWWDLVYRFKKIIGRTDFSDQFRKIIIRHKPSGYNLNGMRQSACLVINPITVDNFATLI